MLIQRNVARFINDITGETCYIKPLPNDYSKLEIGYYYPIGGFLYEYIGEKPNDDDLHEGQIGLINGKYSINDYYYDDDAEVFSIENVMDDIDNDQEMEIIISDYIDKFEHGENIAKDAQSLLFGDGEIIVIPPLDDDDPLTRIMKKMIVHKKLSRKNYKNSFNKSYSLDNLISAINGSTKNMTITKFLIWCDLLSVDWEFILVDNGDLSEYMLSNNLVISSHKDLICDYGDDEKGVFKVPLVDGEDPLKRIIKVALINKNAPFVSYRDRGSKPYQINNMRSALKSNAKMMIAYFINWCEVLGMNYILKVTDPEDGTTFESNVIYKVQEYNTYELLPEKETTK